MPPEARVKAGESMNAAIETAEPGARIIIDPGVYRENVVLTKPLEITGANSGAEFVELDPPDGSCFTVQSGQVVIWGLNLKTSLISVSLLDIDADGVAVDSCTLMGGATTVRVRGSNTTLNECVIADVTRHRRGPRHRAAMTRQLAGCSPARGVSHPCPEAGPHMLTVTRPGASGLGEGGGAGRAALPRW